VEILYGSKRITRSQKGRDRPVAGRSTYWHYRLGLSDPGKVRVYTQPGVTPKAGSHFSLVSGGRDFFRAGPLMRALESETHAEAVSLTRGQCPLTGTEIYLISELSPSSRGFPSSPATSLARSATGGGARICSLWWNRHCAHPRRSLHGHRQSSLNDSHFATSER
jgi:hypothetical protein